MKSYAASAGMEDGIRQQVIKVYSHSSQENEPIFFPGPGVVEISNSAYNEKVQGVMS